MGSSTKKFFAGADVKDAMKMFSGSVGSEDTHNTHNMSYADNNAVVHNAPMKERKEVKSKRFSLLLRPSILAALNKIARMENNSPTDIINTVLENYIKAQSETIAKYETLFDENGRLKI